MMRHTCTSACGRLGLLRVQGHPRLHSEFQVSLGYHKRPFKMKQTNRFLRLEICGLFNIRFPRRKTYSALIASAEQGGAHVFFIGADLTQTCG